MKKEKEKEIYIYIDDMRQPLIPDALWVKSYDEAIATLIDTTDLMDIDDFISLVVDFDHDLGEGKTGYDIAKWLVENNYIGKFRIHSMNPVGANNIRRLLKHYGWTEIF